MSDQHRRTRPDDSSPWVIAVKDLAHSAGLQREITDTWPAPQGLSTPVLGVEPGAPVDVELRLESVHEGVLVTGTADLDLTGECSRCLDPLQVGLTADLQELFLTDVPAHADEQEQALVVLDTIDLEPVLRDAVVTALPFQPVCKDDCAGLCADCGIRLEDAPAGHAHERVDPRWAALAEIMGTENNTSITETEER
ncbi:MAG: YceD family protein [Micrococcus sp.]|nr:YceD family protein [Micrococcus sp.]